MLSPSNNLGPLQVYEAAIASGSIQSDPAQKDAIIHLQRLFEDVTRPRSKPGLLERIFGREKPERIKGLYFWGGVGRGKTFLMDVFFEALPFE